jgi:ubiquinone/menaquinone biosynthesis C-methylase UbiE
MNLREMRKAAEALLEEYPKFVSIDGTAEYTGLADGSVDFVICAQAFHWFDRDTCKREFQRILNPTARWYWLGISARCRKLVFLQNMKNL